MFNSRHRDELEEKGYTVIENAVPDHARLKQDYFDWMRETFEPGSAPYSVHSIVRHYGIGHLEPTWAVRLEVKKYFAQLWGTDQLLTSTDAVAIGQPPEMGVEEFDEESLHWLHVDQCAARIGLHAYQGAVYLETADEDDWTFEVLEGSHELLSTFYASNSKAAIRSEHARPYRLRAEDISWYHAQGCRARRVPVKAGGLLLWDSRLVHANARPLKGRTHPDRWRLLVLVCMAPKAWTTEQDLRTKAEAYKTMAMTTHWPCDDVGLMSNHLPSYATKPRVPPMTALPEKARTLEARQLVGLAPYKITPATRHTAWRPKWDQALRPDIARRTARMYPTGHKKSMTSLAAVATLGVLLIYAVFKAGLDLV